MPAQIFRSLSEADDLFRAALIGLGVCLFVLTIADQHVGPEARRHGRPSYQG